MRRESKIGHKRVASLVAEAVAAAGIRLEGKTPVMVRWTLARGLLAALLVLSIVPLSLVLSASFGDFSAHAQGVIQNIRVEGGKRVEPETVRSYLTFSTGDAYDPAQIDESLKQLFATGLFQDVRIRREGGTIVIVLIETPIVSRVAFEGNREVEDDTLAAEVQLKPRAVYTRARVQADVQRILTVYRRQGLYGASVDPKIINLDNNRIDVVFEINEGPVTKVRAINFIGNVAFSDSQLRYVIATTQTNILSFLKGTNIYDPDRLNLDRELLRQFYMKSGYADVRILSASADLDRDGRGFFITFTIDEGERYRFGTINIESALPSLNIDNLGKYILAKSRRVYNAEKVEKTVEALTIGVSLQGYAFGQVKPRFDRDELNHIMNITFVIDEGPRVAVESVTTGVGQRPRPVQAAVPIWVGGSSKPAMRRAAERGDGWLPQGPPAEGMAAGIDFLLAHRAATRGDDPIVLGALSGPLHVGDPTWETPRCVRGPADKIATYLRTYAELGVDQIQVGFVSRSVDELCDQVAAFATDVAPLVNA